MKLRTIVFVVLMVVMLTVSIATPTLAEGDKNCMEYHYQWMYMYGVYDTYIVIPLMGVNPTIHYFY